MGCGNYPTELQHFSGRLMPLLITGAMLPKPALLPDDPIALKALVVQLHAKNTALSATVRALEQRVATLKRQAVDKAAEKVGRKIEQLELALEDLLMAKAEATSSLVEEDADAAPGRELAAETACSDCGGQLRRVGEDVSAVLDMIVAQLKLTGIVRVKGPCRTCDKPAAPRNDG